MKVLRILNLDGGGMKGLFSAYFMRKFCDDAKINGKELWKHFDFIGGTSIGAIMAGAYAYGEEPQTLIDFFVNDGPNIFTGLVGKGPLDGTTKTLMLTKPEIVPGLPPAINVPIKDGSFYGTDDGSGGVRNTPNAILKAKLSGIFGNTKVFQLKTNVLFTAVERKNNASGQELAFTYRPTLFSNLLAAGLEGQNYLVSEVVQASGSAPFYFPPFPITDSKGVVNKFLDGGIGINNPSAFLLGYANMLGSNYDRIVMLSVGCGLGNVGFFEPKDTLLRGVANAIDNIAYMEQMIGVAGGSAQEAAAKQMQLLSDMNVRINNADFIHYRFNTIYGSAQNTELDNSGADFNTYMEIAAETQYTNDKLKISNFITNCNF